MARPMVVNTSNAGTCEFLKKFSDQTVLLAYSSVLQSAPSNWVLEISQSVGDFVKLACAKVLVPPDLTKVSVRTITFYD